MQIFFLSLGPLICLIRLFHSLSLSASVFWYYVLHRKLLERTSTIMESLFVFGPYQVHLLL
jgi:hypothetical protein